MEVGGESKSKDIVHVKYSSVMAEGNNNSQLLIYLILDQFCGWLGHLGERSRSQFPARCFWRGCCNFLEEIVT